VQHPVNAADELLSVYMSAFETIGCSKAELRLASDMAPATFHRSLNSLLKLGIHRDAGTKARPFFRRTSEQDT
jgi:DNA-binding IclR family transcriptional regulator